MLTDLVFQEYDLAFSCIGWFTWNFDFGFRLCICFISFDSLFHFILCNKIIGVPYIEAIYKIVPTTEKYECLRPGNDAS